MGKKRPKQTKLFLCRISAAAQAKNPPSYDGLILTGTQGGYYPASGAILRALRQSGCGMIERN